MNGWISSALPFVAVGALVLCIWLFMLAGSHAAAEVPKQQKNVVLRIGHGNGRVGIGDNQTIISWRINQVRRLTELAGKEIGVVILVQFII